MHEPFDEDALRAALSRHDVGEVRRAQIRRRCLTALQKRRATPQRPLQRGSGMSLAATAVFTVLASGYLLAIVERTVQLYSSS